MIIARWLIDARFGHKPKVIELIKQWNQDIGPAVGIPLDKIRLLNGSVGVPESTVVMELTLDSLGELNTAWEKMATIPSHAKHAEELEPHIVSGSNRWEIYRAI